MKTAGVAKTDLLKHLAHLAKHQELFSERGRVYINYFTRKIPVITPLNSSSGPLGRLAPTATGFINLQR